MAKGLAQKGFVVPKPYVSGGEKLIFEYSEPTGQAPYTYRLEGTSYGKEWSVNLTHSGLHMLLVEMLKAL